MTKSVSIPPHVARAIAEVHGNAARSWLDQLPSQIETAVNRWGLRLGEPLTPSSCSHAVAATRPDGSAVVLKASYPCDALRDEIAALRTFDGRGVARLVDSDQESGLLLLERLVPGTTLETVGEQEAMAAFCSVVRQLHRPVPAGHRFPTTQDWAAGLTRLRKHFGGGTGPFPSALVSTAASLFEDLHGSASSPVLLHGDLHHGNILAASRTAWLAIDPKGVRGEPAYEAGAFLRNPMSALLELPNAGHVLARRVDYLSDELEMPRDRLLGWATAQAVLAAWWSYEDHRARWEPGLRCAELLLELLKMRAA